MITLILCVIIIGALIWFNFYCNKENVFKKFDFKENAVIKKFNNLLHQLNADNITVIKGKLLETLEQYRTIKKAQFVENRTNLTEALSSVEGQRDIIVRATKQKEYDLRNNKGKISEEEGARLMYDLEIHKDTAAKLQASHNALENKIAALDSKIVQFDSNLALRKARIVSMIADAISIDDRSYIDLRLDSLEQEFKHEANKNAQKQIVDEKMGDSATTPKLEFDLEKYKALYKEFK
jgi:hypothetical protein